MKKTVTVKDVIIGSGEIKIQSMLNVKTTDVEACLKQTEKLKEAGCHIVRLGVPDEASARSLKEFVKYSPLPVVADIHYDYRLALKSIEAGVHKLRINPGNIGAKDKVKAVADAAKFAKIPIRVGVNSGSVEKDLLERFGNTPKALVESAKRNVALLEDFGFSDIVISVKSSSVKDTVESYRLLFRETNYPLHLGVTEAGGGEMAKTKSAIGIGSLLLDGIGDTVRVSLTGDPVEEITAAKRILRAIRLDKNYAEIISCPTCARTECDVEGLRNEIEKLTENVKKPLVIAVMGCTVNGLGEGKEADLGIAGGKGKSVLFKKGIAVKTVNNLDILQEFKILLEEFL